MKVNILYFAHLKELFKKNEQIIDLPEATLAKEVFKFLCEDEKQAELLAKHTMLARNQVYITPEAILKDGDELALIPPVQGG